jgi:DNA primase
MTYLDALAEHGLDPIATSGGRELAIHCPLCQSNSRKLYVNAQTGQWICFVCEERGGSYRLLREVLELDHFQAMRLREKIEGSDSGPRPLYQPETKEAEAARGIKMPPEIHLLTDPAASGQEIFWRYLAYRGVSPRDVERYRMGFALHGRYAYRVIIPVYSEGVMWTFVARGLSNSEPRVLYPEDSKPSRALFNIDNVRGDTVLLVEGVFDALKIGDAAVASFGTSVSAHQRDLLRRKGVKKIVVLWDGDPPGRAGATRVAEQLHAARFDVRLGLLPDGKDPASATWDELQTALLGATPPTTGPIPIWLTDRLDAARAK